jgi:hypothetical protein
MLNIHVLSAVCITAQIRMNKAFIYCLTQFFVRKFIRNPDQKKNRKTDFSKGILAVTQDVYLACSYGIYPVDANIRCT